MKLPFAASVGAVLLFAIAIAVVYNRLVRARNLMAEAWSGVDVQLQRRHNLIPSLVEVVKGYQAHERTVLEEVASARAIHAGASKKQLEQDENQLSQALERLLLIVENYPELKADSQFSALHRQLVEVEDQLQMARRYFNGAVRDHNILAESFPSNLIAKLFRFHSADYFQVDSAIRNVPEVRL